MATALRKAIQLHTEYVAAQRLLLAKVEAAERGQRPWPGVQEYEAVVRLGRLALAEHQRHLEELKACRRESRVGRIQRMSASERHWQPSPELWLSRQQDALVAARDDAR